MKKLVALLLVSMMATVAFAGLDPDTDSFGVYFDTAGNTNTSTAMLFTPFNAYLLLMNPASPTDGFECTVTPTGAPIFILATDIGALTLDVDASANGFAVGRAANYPVVGNAMLLVTWQIMVQATTPLEFRITEATKPSMTGGLPVGTGEGILRRCDVSSGDVTLPVAIVNGTTAPVSEEVNSFGAVKSLFR